MQTCLKRKPQSPPKKIPEEDKVEIIKTDDKALLEKIEKAGLKTGSWQVLVSLSEQAVKSLDKVLDLFLKNEKDFSGWVEAHNREYILHHQGYEIMRSRVEYD